MPFVTHKVTWRQSYVIQIEICAEYRDIIPRPMLICQEPGLRLIGLSPGGPDKSSLCSVQILICSIPCIFHFFYSSVGLVGNFAGLQPWRVPSAIVHCNENEAGNRQSKLPAILAELQLAHDKNTLSFMPQDWWNWQIKWMESVTMGSFKYKNQVNWEFFAYLWVILL